MVGQGRTGSERLRVVYLAGSGHTGSTLLALFMDAHPRIVSVGETSFKRKVQRQGRANLTCTCGASYLECPFWQQVFRTVTAAGFEMNPWEWSNDFRYKGNLTHRLLGRYRANPISGRLQRIATRLIPGQAARMERVRLVNVEFIRAVLHIAGADVFFDTSKRAMRLYQMLQTPELDVKVVHLVRDVRGYVASAKKRGEALEDAARSWRSDREAFEDITRSLPPERLMLLRYEDVCRDPRSWLTRLYDFSGVEPIDPPGSVRSRDHHVLGNNMRRNESISIRLDESWRTRLTAEEQRRVLDIAGPLHARLGYEVPA
jgi:hypothetical protein